MKYIHVDFFDKLKTRSIILANNMNIRLNYQD